MPREWKPDFFYRFLLALLLVCAILLLLPHLRQHKSASGLPAYDYAPGYFSHHPNLGAVRETPVAGSSLRSPACDAPQANR